MRHALRGMFLWILLWVVYCGTRPAQAQETGSPDLREVVNVQVGPAVPLPIHGIARQLSAAAAPDDPDRLFVCTFEINREDGSNPSAGYTSLDGGNTWVRTLLVADSLWVSESSCTAGKQGEVYFAASASETSRGGINHTFGTTEIFRSADGGLTWMPPRRYPFIDWTSLAVAGGADGKNRVFLFGNVSAVGFGDAGEGAWSLRRALMAVSEDGLHFSSPIYPPDEEDPTKVGSFPISSVSDQEGNVFVLFARKQGVAGEFHYVLFKVADKTYKPVGPIKLPSEITEAQLITGQMAIDRSGKHPNRLYVAYPAKADNRHVAQLAISDDGGTSWTASTALVEEGSREKQKYAATFAGIAVDGKGNVALEWLPPGGCPVVGISVDGGQSFAKTLHLGHCDEGHEQEKLPVAVKDNVWTLNRSVYRGQPGEKGPGLTAFIQTASLENSNVVCDLAGRFHVFWNETQEDGRTAFLTAALIVNAAPTASNAFRPSALRDVSEGTVIRVTAQDFDPYRAVYGLDIVVTSPERKTAYPSFLEVVSDHSDCARVSYLNAFTTAEDGHAVFRVPRPEDSTRLLPGEQAMPVHVEVALPGCENRSGSLIAAARERAKPGGFDFNLLSIRFRVLAPSQAPTITARP